MAATFNWSMKGGSIIPETNLQTITTVISASADDVKPTNTAYVAPFGNDITGNGSRKFPFRTLTKAFSITPLVVVAASGTYREQINGGGNILVWGDGNVIIDGTSFTNFGTNSARWMNCTFRNVTLAAADTRFFNCRLSDCSFTANAGLIHDRCIIERATTRLTVTIGNGISTPPNKATNNTYVDCFHVVVGDQANQRYVKWLSIYKNCNIWFSQRSYVSHSVFHNCNVRFSTSQGTAPTLPYTTVPTGYVAITDITELRAAHLAGFPTAADFNFPDVVVEDPLFNNHTIGDYTLDFNSPAKNRSYFGTYVGACSIAKKLRILSNAALSAMDNASAINLTIADDSITLTDVNAVASIVSKPIANLAGREIFKLPTYGINADRNGEVIDSGLDLSPTTIAAGGTMVVSTPYFVQTGAITYNGSVYQPGDRFTSKTSAVGTFTTTAGGVIREILEAPNRETVEVRFAEGALSFTTSGNIVSGSWYYVVGSSVTYDGTTYAAESFFKGTATTTFTGSGSVQFIFATADPYFLFEINKKPTSNNTGNVRTGTILKGNGSADFDYTTANVFPISQKFIQVKYSFQVDNLRP